MSALISFAFSPIGRWVMIGLAVLAFVAYQREQAASDARESCQADQLRQTLEEVTRQREAAREALADAEEQAEQTEAELEQLENDRDQIIADLETGADTCTVPDDIVERLRDIR